MDEHSFDPKRKAIPGVRSFAKLRVERTLLRARLALFWERLWPRLVPALCVAAVFIAVVFFDLLPSLATWLHIVALALFALTFQIGRAHV